jgi:hypothetical protein
MSKHHGGSHQRHHKGNRRRRAIQKINSAIRSLRAARRAVFNRRFERAEENLAKATVFIGKAERKVNRLENK